MAQWGVGPRAVCLGRCPKCALAIAIAQWAVRRAVDGTLCSGVRTHWRASGRVDLWRLVAVHGALD